MPKGHTEGDYAPFTMTFKVFQTPDHLCWAELKDHTCPQVQLMKIIEKSSPGFHDTLLE